MKSYTYTFYKGLKEGNEDEVTIQRAIDLACDYPQGYLSVFEYSASQHSYGWYIPVKLNAAEIANKPAQDVIILIQERFKLEKRELQQRG